MLSPINGDCALTVALSELHLKLRQNYAEMRKHPSRAWGGGGGGKVCFRSRNRNLCALCNEKWQACSSTIRRDGANNDGDEMSSNETNQWDIG